MAVHLDAHVFQLGLKLIRPALAAVLGNHNASHVEALVLELLDQAEHVHVVGDAQIAPDLILLVRGKAGKNPGGVEVVEELAAKFQVQFVAELADALFNVL